MPSIKYSDFTFKTSEDSVLKIDKGISIAQQLNFNSTEPQNGACLGLTFKINMKRRTRNYDYFKSIDERFFTCPHEGIKETPLSAYLSEIKEWSEENNYGHLPVLIRLVLSKEVLHEFEKFPAELDTYLNQYFGQDLIFSPGDLKSGSASASLFDYLNSLGGSWPTLDNEKLVGKFIFCLSQEDRKEEDNWAVRYAEVGRGILCFGAKEIHKDDIPPSEGNIIFFHFKFTGDKSGRWAETIEEFNEIKAITLAEEVNSKEKWIDAIDSEVSFDCYGPRHGGKMVCVFKRRKLHFQDQVLLFEEQRESGIPQQPCNQDDQGVFLPSV